MSHKAVTILIIVVVLLIVGGLIWYYFRSSKLGPITTFPWGPVTGSHPGTGTGTPAPTGPLQSPMG